MQYIEIGVKGWNEFCHLPGFPSKVNSEIDVEFFEFGILIKEGEKAVARIACFINPYHQSERSKVITIGYLECIDSYNIFKMLLDHVKNLEKWKEYDLLGPINGSTWNSYRLVDSEQNNPFFLEPITAAYLPDFFIKYGFSDFATFFSQSTNELIDLQEKVAKRKLEFEEMGIRFDNFDRAFAQKEFTELGDFCMKAFSKNVLFSPISTSKFVSKMMPLMAFLDPQFTIIARHNGKVVGFLFGYTDIFNKEEKTIVIKTIARDLDGPYQGMGSILSSIAMTRAISQGYTRGIHALMIETNKSKNISNKFQGEYLRKYTLYTLDRQTKTQHTNHEKKKIY